MGTGLIGRPLGTLSARSVESSTTVDTGQSVDFSIGGLSFNILASDENPYERATADFRKQQFDNAPTPGEQGLDGWWLRSQMSFHRGAGVEFYELLDGETVLNRFDTGSNIDCWTPGRVVLSRALDSESLTGPRYVEHIDGTYVILKDSGALATYSEETSFSSGSETAIDNSTGDSAGDSLTASATTAYIAVGDTIDSWNGSASALWTHTSDEFTHVFFLKGRLWAIDTGSRVYMLSTAGGSVGEAGAFGSVSDYPTTAPHQWSATAVPSGILLARDNRIYLVTLDETATTPTPLAPTLAAELPNDEVISAIRYGLGYVAIATSKGVRFAVVDDSLALGPRVVDGDFSSCTRVAFRGSRALVTGTTEDQSGMFAFDLANQVDDLLPGYVLEAALTGSLTYSGVLGGTSGTVAWSSAGDYIARTFEDGTLAASGELVTGFHRFGTLEPKKFQSVRVRLAGAGGTVAVARVMADGSTVTLYTFDVGSGQGEEITLSLAATQEMLGLKFTLTRDADDDTRGPELLGYQLRALPAPLRQRLIRVPLSIFDVERASSGRTAGHLGEAWERLEALEEMEKSGGTFAFRDFRTGEAGECYIEKLEHRGTTAPSRRDSGFGGVAYLTIRKL